MAVKTAAQAGQNWLNAAPRATANWSAGIQATQVDPTQLAAQQAQKAVLNFSAVVNSGQWARRLADAGKAKWQANSLAKQANYSTGYSAGQSAYEQGYTAFWNYMGPQLQTILAMQKNSIQDSIARASAFIQAAHAYQKP